MQARVSWKNAGLKFEGTADSGSMVKLSSAVDKGTGDEGFRPMELLGVGLAGCTGMDVISILQKKRQVVESFEVFVDTKNAEEHPHVWTQVTIKYLIRGRDIDRAAVERAIELSRDKYCPAQAMIRQAVKISMTYEIEES